MIESRTNVPRSLAERLLRKGWLPAHQTGYVCSEEDICIVERETWRAMHVLIAASRRRVALELPAL